MQKKYTCIAEKDEQTGYYTIINRAPGGIDITFFGNAFDEIFTEETTPAPDTVETTPEEPVKEKFVDVGGIGIVGVVGLGEILAEGNAAENEINQPAPAPEETPAPAPDLGRVNSNPDIIPAWERQQPAPEINKELPAAPEVTE